MKKATNKILSFLSAFAMVLGILVAPFTSANAAEPNDTPARPVIEEPANPDENKPEKPTDDKDKQADDKDKTDNETKPADDKTDNKISNDTAKINIHKIVMDVDTFTNWKSKDHKYDGSEIEDLSKFFGEKSKEVAGVHFDIYKVVKAGTEGAITGTALKKDYPSDQIKDDKAYLLVKGENKDKKDPATDTKESGTGEIDLSEYLDKDEKGNTIETQFLIVENLDKSDYNEDGKTLSKEGKAIPALITLPTTVKGGVLNLYPKNTSEGKPVVDKDFEGHANAKKDREEIDNKIVEDVNVGDKAPYEIETLIPANAKYKTSVWTDQMTEGLTFNKDSMKVAIGPKDSEKALDAADYTVTEDGNGFILELTESGLKKINGQKEETRVHITYSATVNDKAKVQRPERNDVIFHYGNNPGHGNTPYPTKPNQETGELTVTKDFPDIKGGWSKGEEVKATLIDAHTGKPVEFTDGQKAKVTLKEGEESHTWKNLDKDRQYKVVEDFTPGDQVTYVKDKDGSIKIEDKKTKNPSPLNPQEPAVVTYGHRFQKVDQEGTGLKDAEFVVKKDNKYLTAKDGKTLEADQEAYVKAEKAYKDAVAKATKENPDKENIDKLKEARDKAYEKAQSEWIFEDSKDKAEIFKSNEDGFFKVTGIKPGKYQLEETKAPKGYAERKEPIDFEVVKDSKGTTTLDAGKLKDDKGFTQVENKKVTIPQTGGIGSLIFIVIGIAIMAVAFAMKRRNSYEEA